MRVVVVREVQSESGEPRLDALVSILAAGVHRLLAGEQPANPGLVDFRGDVPVTTDDRKADESTDQK